MPAIPVNPDDYVDVMTVNDPKVPDGQIMLIAFGAYIVFILLMLFLRKFMKNNNVPCPLPLWCLNCTTPDCCPESCCRCCEVPKFRNTCCKKRRCDPFGCCAGIMCNCDTCLPDGMCGNCCKPCTDCCQSCCEGKKCCGDADCCSGGCCDGCCEGCCDNVRCCGDGACCEACCDSCARCGDWCSESLSGCCTCCGRIKWNCHCHCPECETINCICCEFRIK